MNSMVRERSIHAVPLFIAITPEIRRALEMLAEASISLLDEIERPTEGLEEVGDDEPSLGWTSTAYGQVIPGEPGDDREADDSDFEEDDFGENDDPEEESDADEYNGDFEPELGWLTDGAISLSVEEVDFLPPEASGEFNRSDYCDDIEPAAQKATFKTAPRPKRLPWSSSLRYDVEVVRMRRIVMQHWTKQKHVCRR